jgi:hypothetical protein
MTLTMLMKTWMNPAMRRAVLSPALLSLVVIGCREEAPKETQSSKVRPNTEQTAKPAAAQPERDPQTGMLMGSLDGEALAKKDGVAALKYIIEHSEGEDRDAILHHAMVYLSDRYTKIQLLAELNKLPPGAAKEKIIFEIFNEKPETVRTDLFEAINALDFPEERERAWLCCGCQLIITSPAELKMAEEFMAKSQCFSEDEMKSRKDMLTRQFTEQLIQRVTDLEAPAAAQGILSLPEDRQPAVVQQVIYKWTTPAFGGAKQYEKLMEFTAQLNDNPELARAAYKQSFISIGVSIPKKLVSYLDKVPAEYRAVAVEAGTKGWLSDDPIAATAWASQLPAADQKAAAGPMVDYLTRKKAAPEAIQRWKSLLGQ